MRPGILRLPRPRPLPTISESPQSPVPSTSTSTIKKDLGKSKQIRSSKTTQKHVTLPTAAQDAPLPSRNEVDDTAAWYDEFEPEQEERTMGEQMTSEQRDEAGYLRLTAYYACEEFKWGLLSSFLKREHAVTPRWLLSSSQILLLTDYRILRIYDDAIYTVCDAYSRFKLFFTF